MINNYCIGQSLRYHLNNPESVFNPDEMNISLVKKQARAVLNALAYLHGKGIAHRNLNAKNIVCALASGLFKLGGLSSKIVRSKERGESVFIPAFGQEKTSLSLQKCDINIDEAEKDENYEC